MTAPVSAILPEMCLKPTGTVSTPRRSGRRWRPADGWWHVAHRRAVPTLVFEKVVVEQHQNLVGMEELSRVVDDAPSRSASPSVAMPMSQWFCNDEVLQADKGLYIGRRRRPPKRGVTALVDYVYIAAGGDENGLQGGFADPCMGSSTTFRPRERMASIFTARMMESTYWFIGLMSSMSPARTPSSKGRGHSPAPPPGRRYTAQVRSHHFVRVPVALW